MQGHRSHLPWDAFPRGCRPAADVELKGGHAMAKKAKKAKKDKKKDKKNKKK